MSLEEKLNYEGYAFKFDEGSLLMVKSIDEIKKINQILKEESSESDYESYTWYLSAEKAVKIKYKKLKVDMQVSWHGGLPFYKLRRFNNEMYTIAEFYLQKYVKIEPDSEGLVLNDTFKNIPEQEGVHV